MFQVPWNENKNIFLFLSDCVKHLSFIHIYIRTVPQCFVGVYKNCIQKHIDFDSTLNLKKRPIHPGSCVKRVRPWKKITMSWIIGSRIFFQVKNSWMAFLCITKEFKFPLRCSAVRACGQVQGSTAQTGLCWRRRDPFTEMDQLIFTIKTWLAPQPDLFSFHSQSAVPH